MNTCQALAASYATSPNYKAIIAERGESCAVGNVTLDHNEILQRAIKAAAVSYSATGATPATRRERRQQREARKAAYAAQASQEFGITIKPKWIALGVVGLFIVAMFGAPALLLIILGYVFEQMLDSADEDPQAFDSMCFAIAGAE